MYDSMSTLTVLHRTVIIDCFLCPYSTPSPSRPVTQPGLPKASRMVLHTLLTFWPNESELLRVRAFLCLQALVRLAGPELRASCLKVG